MVYYRRAFLDTAHLSAQPTGLRVTSHIRRFRHNLLLFVLSTQRDICTEDTRSLTQYTAVHGMTLKSFASDFL